MNEIYFNDRDGNTVLSNNELRGLLLGHITVMRELDEAEQVNINDGLIWLSQQKNQAFLTEKFIKLLHKKLFGKVWKWAGQYRKSEKNIGIDAYKVPVEMMKLIDDINYWVENSSYDQNELIARFHHRLVWIHPFPNGNGRFSRIYTNYLCKRYGFKRPEWQAHLNPILRRKMYIHCLQQADQKKFQPLIHFLSEPITQKQSQQILI